MVQYERAQLIEQRLSLALDMIKSERPNASQLAARLEVSSATAARVIAALKGRGNPIRAVRDARYWRYELAPDERQQADARPRRAGVKKAFHRNAESVGRHKVRVG